MDEWVDALVGEDGCSMMSLDGMPISVTAVRKSADEPDLMRVLPGCQLPEDISGAPNRPNVLMFADGEVDDTIITQQSGKFDCWLASLDSDAKLVVVEIGAGTAVATIRYCAESTASRFRNSTFVRINLDDYGLPFGDNYRDDLSVPLGALDALSRIDKVIDALDDK
jgi:hypothetical protein